MYFRFIFIYVVQIGLQYVYGVMCNGYFQISYRMDLLGLTCYLSDQVLISSIKTFQVIQEVQIMQYRKHAYFSILFYVIRH